MPRATGLVAVALVLGPLVLAGCTDDDAAEEASCDVVALNRNADDSVGKAKVVTVSATGNAKVITGDWVATRPSFSPDGRRLAVVRADGDYESGGPSSLTIWVMDRTGRARQRLTSGRSAQAPDWSPDGETIAYAEQDPRTQLWVVPAKGGHPRVLVDELGGDQLMPAWSPDGDRLAVARLEYEVDRELSSVWTVGADGKGLEHLADISPAVHDIAWHPDGSTLLVSSFALEDGRLHLVDPRTGDIHTIADHATFAAWSGDGERIYYFTKEGASTEASWRLAEGRLEDGRLRRDRYIGAIDEYLYPYFGLDVGPC